MIIYTLGCALDEIAKLRGYYLLGHDLLQKSILLGTALDTSQAAAKEMSRDYNPRGGGWTNLRGEAVDSSWPAAWPSEEDTSVIVRRY